MTVQRWVTTTLLMGVVGAGLLALRPDAELVRAAVTGPQQLLDTGGPDVLLVLLAWALAALCWAWGVLGLVLTGLSTLPGLAGRAAGVAVLVLVPAGIRRVAAVAVGVSLVATPAVAVPGPPAGGAALSVAASDVAVPPGPAPDWPTSGQAAPPPPEAGATAPPAGTPTVSDTTDTGPVPDWPAPPPAGAHVVVRGDTLWDLAASRLTASGRAPSAAAVATAVQAWWQANAGVIGDDPDLLLPGQVLLPPP